MKQAAVVTVAMAVGAVNSFVIPPTSRSGVATFRGKEGRILDGSQSVSLSAGFDISSSDGSPPSIDAAAAFMVDAFWLQSPQNLLTSGADDSAVSDSLRTSLGQRQADDLSDKYGERMGKRLLESSLITAKEEGASEILGLVAIEARLFDMSKKEIYSAEQSESLLKNAVASLGPKQRRQYKDSSVSEIVAELTSPEITAICVLSNLSVSPKARRKGLGGKLCAEAERIAKEEWEFDRMYLKVEAENSAAKGLYTDKLGFDLQYEDATAMGLRVDVDAGDFTEVPAATLVLAKAL